MKLWAIVPELIVAGACLPLVATAGFARGRARHLPVLFALAALLVATAVTMRMVHWLPMAIFDGTYIVDRLGTVFKITIEAGALITLLLLPGQFTGDEVIPHAPVALMFATAGAMALCSSADLGLIVLFFQMMSLASYVLAALDRASPRAHEAALKYFIFGATALAVMAYGLTFVYGLTGSLDLAVIGHAVRRADGVWLAVAFTLVVVGYGFEMTLVPFHLWSPDMFDGATSPIAGFVSVVPKVAAFAALLRFITVVMPPGGDGWNIALAVAAAITMTLGNVVALRQTTLKRLLAYSSIGQAGYVLAATAVVRVAPNAADAVAFYLLAYGFMNLAAFGIVAAIERTHGGDGLDGLNGLGRTSPWAGAVSVIALLSLAGIPPSAGFAGKILLLQAMIGGGMTWLAIVAILNMVIGLYYYAMLAGRLYFEIPPSSASPTLDGFTAVAMAAATAGTLVLGVWPAFGLFR
jgi:NADH-quinone oxidoreductase subunit N